MENGKENKENLIFALIGLILSTLSTIIYLFINFYTFGSAKLILLIGLVVFLISATIFSIFGYSIKTKANFLVFLFGIIISANMFISICFQIFQYYIFI